jgi:hypothetical protein
METEVMKAIEPQLHLVQAIGLEFHGTGARACDEEEELLRLLRDGGFQLSVSRKSRAIFPPEIDAWVERVHPYVSVIKATRPSERSPASR